MSELCQILKGGAREIEINATPSQVGPAPSELREAANEIERLHGLVDLSKDELRLIMISLNHYLIDPTRPKKVTKKMKPLEAKIADAVKAPG